MHLIITLHILKGNRIFSFGVKSKNIVSEKILISDVEYCWTGLDGKVLLSSIADSIIQLNFLVCFCLKKAVSLVFENFFS